MATLNQGEAGLQGWSDTPPKVKVKPDAPPQFEMLQCEACRCRWQDVIETRRRKKSFTLIEGMCPYCAGFFGHSDLPGATNESPERALAQIAKLRDMGFLLLLRNRSLAARDGNILNLGAGDIFQCSPGNPEPDPDATPSKDRTWAMFMLEVQIGPYEVRLFPHEWSPISFKTVMDLKSAGEVSEAFISGMDKVGHFTPTPELRRQIEAVFGHLIK